MNRFLFAALLILVLPSQVWSQSIPLINASEILEKAKSLHDEDKFQEALELYETIPPQDTAYVISRAEMVLTYNAMKDYQKALALSEELLKDPQDWKRFILKNYAIALDLSGDFPKSAEVFEQMIKEFPYDYSGYFNFGVTLLRAEKIKEAEDMFFQSIARNPYHLGSHANLAKIAVMQGHKTHAMLSLGVFLALNNTNNYWLIYLENLCSNQLEDEEATIPSQSKNSFRKLDQIIKSKLALEKSFKSKIPLNAALIKQFEMFFQQIDEQKLLEGDQWFTYYMPIFKDIKANSLSETFIYHILTSSSFAAVPKWKKKNEKLLQKFYDVANKGLRERREMLPSPPFAEKQELLPAYYFNSGELAALGVEDENEYRFGNWYFFNSQATLTAYGAYNKDDKIGQWIYYYDDGKLRMKEDYDKGYIEIFHPEGTLSTKGNFKDNQLEGPFELYYECGNLKEKLDYVKGKRNGPGEIYYTNGQLNTKYFYEDDQLQGEYLEYFNNGQLFSKANYKDGETDGEYKEYYKSGVPSLEGYYKEGNKTGEWKYFYENGQLASIGSFKDDVEIGIWKRWDEQGLVSSIIHLNEKGKAQGIDSIFYQGKLYVTEENMNGVLVGLKYFDQEGNITHQFSNPKGSMKVQFYNAFGRKVVEGQFVEGKKQGLWHFFNHHGLLTKEIEYKDDKEHGTYRLWHPNGKLREETTYQNGDLHGFYTAYHANGNKSSEGWFQNNLREQIWKTYYPNGVLEDEAYYLQGKIKGYYLDFDLDGLLLSRSRYNKSRFEDFEYFNEQNENISLKKVDGSKLTVLREHKGKIISSLSANCFELSDDLLKNFPDGTTFSRVSMLTGSREGEFFSYFPNGLLNVKGKYLSGNQHGEWVYYHENGQVSSKGIKKDGDYHGKWEYFFPDGKLRLISYYENDNKEGVEQVFSASGTLVLEKLFIMDELHAYRKAGESEWKVLNSSVDSIEIFNVQGALIFKESFNKGRLDGEKMIAFDNGQIAYQVFYKMGLREGAFKVYHANGKLFSEENYLSGEIHGESKFYNTQGQLEMTRDFVEGYAHGISQVFKNGKTVKTIKYRRGEPYE